MHSFSRTLPGLFALRFAADVRRVGASIGLDVLELPGLVPDGIELPPAKTVSSSIGSA